MALAPVAVPPDSTNSRQHRGQLATAVNGLISRVFKPNPVVTGTASGDASAAISSTGNPVLVSGQINLAVAAATYDLKRGSTVLATFANSTPAKNLPIVFLDVPGTGPFTYSTAGGGNTNSATLRAVELK